jgi:hypothetical protein
MKVLSVRLDANRLDELQAPAMAGSGQAGSITAALALDSERRRRWPSIRGHHGESGASALRSGWSGIFINPVNG